MGIEKPPSNATEKSEENNDKPDERTESRRRFLRAVVFGVAATGAGAIAGKTIFESLSDASPTPGRFAERFKEKFNAHDRIGENNPAHDTAFENFPGAIPGARHVAKHLFPGAKRVLVHVLQAHDRPELTEERRKEVQRVQDDIYKILSALAQEEKISTVYAEAVVGGEFEKQLKALWQKQGEIEKNLASLTTDMKTIDAKELELAQMELALLEEDPDSDRKIKRVGELRERIKALNSNNAPKSEQQEKSGPSVESAVGRLARQGLSDIRAVETWKANQRANELIKENLAGENINPEEFEKIVAEAREEIALEMIANDPDAPIVAPIVYGGYHEFLNNLAKWNRKNPNQGFSLIEILPESYAALRK